MPHHEQQSYTAEEIRLIMDFIHARPIRTIHYMGLGDRDLIETILDTNKFKLTLLFERGSRPAWLRNGIASFDEGGPFINDCSIKDVSWSTPETFNTILTWKLMPRRPHYFILAKDAVEFGLHRFYRWQEQDGIFFGEIKKRYALKLSDEDRAFREKNDAFMRGELKSKKYGGSRSSAE
jgi:hypothetical protein